MALESWILGEELNDLLPNLIQQLRLAECVHCGVGETVLPRTHQLTDTATPHVLRGENETVFDPSDQLKTFQRAVRGIVREQEAMTLSRTASDAAAELM